MNEENTLKTNKLYSSKIQEAYTFYKQKEYSNCINLLNEAIEIDTCRYEAFYYLGIVYSRQKEYKTSVDYLEKALKKNDKEIKIYRKIVKNLRFYDVNSAIAFAKSALETHMDYILCTMLAVLYSNTNNDFEAEKYFFKSLDINPNYSITYCEMVSHFAKRSKIKEAVFYCEKLVTIEPQNLTFILRLCRLYLENKESYKALKLVDNYIPNNSMSLLEIEKISLLYEELQEKDKAMKYFAEAVKLNTKNLEIYKKYLIGLEEKTPNITKKNVSLFLFVCEKAFLNSNPDVEFMLAAAILYSLSENYKEAQELYLKVLSIDKKNETAKMRLKNIKRFL